jgi:uncharacterized membrane protein YfcA
MWSLPLSTPQKVGIVVYGLTVGACVAAGTSAALCLLGTAITEFAQSTGWINLGENQPWLPVMGLTYGLLLGIILGAIVCRKVIKSRLRGTPTH